MEKSVYELRIYHANSGKIAKLIERFRDHTVDLFADHGMESIAYWIADDAPDDLIYVLKHSGDPKANWEKFRSDERWISVKASSETDGVLVGSIDSRYMTPTDFSRIK